MNYTPTIIMIAHIRPANLVVAQNRNRKEKNDHE